MKALDAAALAHRADDGNIWCQFLLGTRLLQGDGVEPDQFKAFDYYLKAAVGGLGEAQNMVARFIHGGYVDGHDPVDAAAWDFIAVMNHTKGAGDIFLKTCQSETAIEACRARAREIQAQYPAVTSGSGD
jgi:TPR repeat protein